MMLTISRSMLVLTNDIRMIVLSAIRAANATTANATNHANGEL